jgi:threonine dehydratase
LRLEPVTLEAARQARARIAGGALRTPLVRLNAEGPPGVEVYLKLECLQPIGSFKVRGAGNALLGSPPEALARGVYTASAGNMAQGVAFWAGRLGVPCTALVPENAPETKLGAIARLGARSVKLPYAEWWQTLVDHGHPSQDGLFVHPVSNPAVMAGNSTIALEIAEDLPEVDAVLVPYGGGGLSCGIAAVMRALRPEARVYACEVETAAPLDASLRAGHPSVIQHQPSFADGIGGRSVLEEMWPLARTLLAGSIVVSVAEIAAAVRLLAERNRVVAEGAGGASVAAALKGVSGASTVVCVVSGGNIDAARLVRVLQGEIP